MNSVFDFLISTLIAAIPGILIAIFAHELDVRRHNRMEEQEMKNGRTLLGLEIESNRAALVAFWQEINGLDKEPAEGKRTDKHLASMAEGGFLTYPLPHWNFTRWHHAQPTWLSALDGKEIVQIDRFYRDLQLIEDLHRRTVTLTPQEQELIDHDRFWANRYGGMRDLLFDRLAKVVERASSATNLL